jgi:hypothetical protein
LGNLAGFHFINIRNLSSFSIWFLTGFTHIVDFEGVDHILFLLVLCGVYTVRQWKSLLVLITSFTVGHSFTLALSLVGIININADFIEFLIPLTIITTCFYNLYNRKKLISGSFKANYWIALFFGFIHGLGFSRLLRSLLGNSENILSPLFAFNIGLEAGQLIIISVIIVFSLVLTELFKVRQTRLNVFLSLTGLTIAGILAITRFIELIN